MRAVLAEGNQLNEIFSVAFALFLVANPIGNSPVILGLLKDFDLERQKKILLRESFFGFILAIFFQFFGEVFLSSIGIQSYALTYCGGILLLLVGISLIFAKPEDNTVAAMKQEPYIVPITTPLIAGPGVMTMIMIFSQKEPAVWKTTLSITIAWVFVTLVLFLSPYLLKVLKKKGMLALEQLMGLMLAMISIQMLVKGTRIFLQQLHGG